MSAQVGNGPGAANDRPVKKPNYATDFIARRSRSTLVEVVDALSKPMQIGAIVFRAYRNRPYAVFLDEPRMALPLCYEDPGLPMLRTRIERAGFGQVSRSMMVDALAAAVLPISDWPGDDRDGPQRVPVNLMACLVRENQLLGVQS
jgi:hypothetical protein